MSSSRNKYKLNDNIITWLTPIYFLHRILGSSRVIIKDKFITTSGSWDMMYSIVWMIAVTTSLVHYAKVYYFCYYDKSVVVYVGFTLIIALQYVSYILNLVYIRFFNKEANLQLFLLLQKINSDLRLGDSKLITKTTIVVSIFFLILIIVPFEIFFAVHVIHIINEPVYTAFLSFGLMIIYIDIVLTGFFLTCLTLHIGYLNNLIKQYNIRSMPEYRDSGVKRWRFLENYLDALSRENADKDPVEFYEYLGTVRDILKCFKSVTDLFSFTVMNVAATVLIWTFIVIAALFFGMQLNLLSKVGIFTDAMWPVFYFLQLTILALDSDMFLRETKNTKLLCIQVLSHIYDGPIRKAARNMIREIQIANPTFSVYGIFTLDKRIPLHLFGIISSNIIVLTQFSD